MTMKTLFHKTTWSQVKAGDVVLVTHDEGEIAEVEVKEVQQLRQCEDGKERVVIYHRFRHATYGIPFEVDGTAYIQSRL